MHTVIKFEIGQTFDLEIKSEWMGQDKSMTIDNAQQ